MGVTSTLVPLDSNGTSAPVQPVGAAARAGLQVPNWRLLRGRAAQSPIDDTIRRQLSDVFFPNDAVSVDISHSSPLPFANELRSMFSVYAEKQFLTLEDVAAGFEAACLAFASRTPDIVVADNIEFRKFLHEVFFVVCADDSALLASLLSLESADNSPLCEEGGRGFLLQSNFTTPASMIDHDPSSSKDPSMFLDEASHAAIDLIVSQYEPPAAIRHLLYPPQDQPQPKQISLNALSSIASCTGPLQHCAQEFHSKYAGLWDLVGADFVSQAQLRQLLVQVMSSFRLSSAYSKAAVRLYIERKLGHAKATLHEHLHLKFVVGKRYRCEVHDSDSMDTSMDSASRPMQECVLIRHLDGEYEVELAAADQCYRLVRVKILHEIHVEAVDDCDWSDEAYTRDSPQVLAAIAADFPYFRMEHRRPEPQHRTPWPIKFYHPPGSQHVRSRMDFDEVDYGIHFSPFLAEAMLPNLSGEKRTWLMKTALARETNRCFWLHMGVSLGVHPVAMQAYCRERCTALSSKIDDLDARDAFEDCQFFSEPIRSVLRRRGSVNASEMDNVRLIIIVCVEGWISMHDWNLFTPRLRERGHEPWEGRDIILKLEHGHFTILEPHDKTLEHPIDHLLAMMKSEGFEPPGELGPFCHLESNLGMPLDETRCASAAQLYEQIQRM